MIIIMTDELIGFTWRPIDVNLAVGQPCYRSFHMGKRSFA
jgi:hypothetical protein